MFWFFEIGKALMNHLSKESALIYKIEIPCDQFHIHICKNQRIPKLTKKSSTLLFEIKYFQDKDHDVRKKLQYISIILLIRIISKYHHATKIYLILMVGLVTIRGYKQPLKI